MDVNNLEYRWAKERLEACRVQALGSYSLAAKQAYINGLEFELADLLRRVKETARHRCNGSVVGAFEPVPCVVIPAEIFDGLLPEGLKEE